MSLSTHHRSSRRAIWARRVLAGFLALHGFAHFAGTSSNIQLLDHHDSAALLGGLWHPASPALLGTFALLWAATGIGFLATASLVWIAHPAARTALVSVSAVSLVLSVSSLWAAVAGVVIDVVLLALPRRYPNQGPSSPSWQRLLAPQRGRHDSVGATPGRRSSAV